MGNIILKTPDEIKIMRKAGGILSKILKKVAASVADGITTRDIDLLTESLIVQQGCRAAFKGYRGFPGSACVSVNQEVVHGIPGNRKIKNGDIVSIDVGLIYQGYYADTATTVAVGPVSEQTKRLVEVTRESLHAGIIQARAGQHLSDISHAVQKHVEHHGFSVVRDFVGHGIGATLHEEPEIPNYGPPHTGPILREGMVFCIEPMVNMGSWQTKIMDDGWTVETEDGKPSAHFEHMIAVTAGGPDILTE
ncbi:MAG TPA: type I methionyl aminopeptidase [Candidatus Omnitrophota bacterium]|nr:type I methionyl aminopeptidase [Candidatus Omnitrophota bacterium]HSA31422.1 type I methionyl aminopeptidase [Candidatus Omnitrophota bacterium]